MQFKRAALICFAVALLALIPAWAWCTDTCSPLSSQPCGNFNTTLVYQGYSSAGSLFFDQFGNISGGQYTFLPGHGGVACNESLSGTHLASYPQYHHIGSYPYVLYDAFQVTVTPVNPAACGTGRATSLKVYDNGSPSDPSTCKYPYCDTYLYVQSGTSRAYGASGGVLSDINGSVVFSSY